ncbi:polysaccharide biosynthesis/export family protein [Benzoatithermus flavus]|jgi:polysaccharide export outer membrane protein|uniref:Polysaccharide biosynthesis/export family protein n=1 Tax=Benzoatithermus flavus TaxID=3108223 RepID=A0ABU8XXV9_9PROT
MPPSLSRRRQLRVLAAALLAAGATPAAAGTEPAAGAYRLNPGDVIRLSVWKEESLTREATVQPDGSVSFPLAGQVPAAGRTAAELENEVRNRIARYVADPVVTIELLDARGNRVYVLGEVQKPGQFQLDRPTSLVQALALAGGLTPFAARKSIRLLRRDEKGVEQVTILDLDRVTKDTSAAGNLVLQAGDTIIVPGGSLF